MDLQADNVMNNIEDGKQNISCCINEVQKVKDRSNEVSN